MIYSCNVPSYAIARPIRFNQPVIASVRGKLVTCTFVRRSIFVNVIFLLHLTRCLSSAWLKNEDSTIVARLSRLIEAVTNLSMTTAEDLQVDTTHAINEHVYVKTAAMIRIF
jgi:hypothetical protein